MPNLIIDRIGNVISFCLFLALIGCSQPANYAPVKTVNEAFIPDGVIAPRSKIQRNSVKLAKPETKINIKEKDPQNNEDSMPLKSYVNRSRADFDSQATGVIGGEKRRESDKKRKAISPKIGKANPNEINRMVATPAKVDLKVVDSNPNRRERQPDTKLARLLPIIPKSAKKGKSLQTQTKSDVPIARKKNNEKISIISNNNKKVLKLSFEWPISGKVVRNFAQSDSKGIDISGKNGQKVRAAESGKAVYCGSGLAGYGNLVIIKHNQDYLSAYAHNRRLSVKEGQMVDKGQPIGELGLAGFKKTILHFEIRKNGKAINPLTLLPKF